MEGGVQGQPWWEFCPLLWCPSSSPAGHGVTGVQCFCLLICSMRLLSSDSIQASYSAFSLAAPEACSLCVGIVLLIPCCGLLFSEASQSCMQALRLHVPAESDFE
jgi:hypothetical protein